MLGAYVIQNPIKILEDTQEVFKSIKATLAARLTPLVEVDEIERGILGGIGKDASRLSHFEKFSREGSYVGGFGTNANLQSALIKEATKFKQPEDMNKGDFEKLKTSYISIDTHLHAIAELSSRIATHGTGVEVLNDVFSRLN